MHKTYILNKSPIEFLEIEKKFKKVFSKNKHPSWMFIGRRGIGKSLVASYLAYYVIKGSGLNVKNKKTLYQFSSENMYELTFVSPLEKSKSGMISKEQIDQLLLKLNSLSSTGSWRIIIIDKLNLLSNSAMNAMLKILEEPKRKIAFFFIVDNLSKIPSTISSRCQKLFFSQLSRESCNEILRDNLPELSFEDLNSLAILSENSPGLAIELFHLSAHSLYSDILNSIFDKSKIREVSERVYNSSKNSIEISNLYYFLLKRIFYILSIHKVETVKNNMDYIFNEFELIEKLKDKFSIINILDILNDLNKRYKRIDNYNTNSSLEIYQVLSKLNQKVL